LVRVLAALALVLSLCTVCEAQGKKVYDWTFEQGRLVTFQSKAETSIALTLGGKKTGDVYCEVESTNLHRTRALSKAGLANLELGATRTKVKVRYGKTTVQWDSQDPKLRKVRSLPYIKPFAASHERKFLVDMDVPGRTVRDLRVEPNNGAKTVTPPRSLELSREAFQAGRRFFPTTPIGIGDSWPRVMRTFVGKGVILAFKGTRELVGFVKHKGRRCLKVKTALKGALESAKPGQKRPSTYELLEATYEDVTLFELERGLIVQTKHSTTVKLSKALEVKDRGKLIEVEARTTTGTTEVLSVAYEGK
jgi:hypothetical protein